MSPARVRGDYWLTSRKEDAKHVIGIKRTKKQHNNADVQARMKFCRTQTSVCNTSRERANVNYSLHVRKLPQRSSSGCPEMSYFDVPNQAEIVVSSCSLTLPELYGPDKAFTRRQCGRYFLFGPSLTAPEEPNTL